MTTTMHPPYIHCKITDFGFTVPGVSNQYYLSTRRRSTEAYCAPELIFQSLYSSKSDIWAMGCILFESCFATVDQRRAFSDLHALATYNFYTNRPPPQIGWFAFGLNRNDYQYCPYRDRVENIWAGLNVLFAACFRRNPNERPDADTLCNNLVFVLEGKPLTIPDYRPV
jgi:serine/threonine protein kinase